MNIRLKKISDEGNCLGFDTAIILQKNVRCIVHGEHVWGDDKLPADHYLYEYLAIVDGVLSSICSEDFETSMHCYEVVENSDMGD